MGDPVRGVGCHGRIAARELVTALSASFHEFQSMLDGIVDGLIIAGLEVQHWSVDGTTPIAAIERVRADQIHGAANRHAILRRKDKQQVVGHTLAQQGKGLAGQIGRPPFAAARVHVEDEERIEMLFGYFVSAQMHKLQPLLSLLPLLAQILAFGRREVIQKISERMIVFILPVELLVCA